MDGINSIYITRRSETSSRPKNEHKINYKKVKNMRVKRNYPLIKQINILLLLPVS
jgi:hypothetical protein